MCGRMYNDDDDNDDHTHTHTRIREARLFAVGDWGVSHRI
jgi:hypothetical protein